MSPLPPIVPTTEDLVKMRADMQRGGKLAVANSAFESARQAQIVLALLDAYEAPVPKMLPSHTLVARMASSIAAGLVHGYETVSPGVIDVVADTAVDIALIIIERIQAADPETNQ